MKVLFVHSSAGLYGADRCLLSLARGLSERGCRVDAVLPERGPLVDSLQHYGIRVHIIDPLVFRRDLFTPRGAARLVIGAPLAVWRLQRLIGREKYDIIHTNTSVVLGGAIAAKLRGRRHVWHFREFQSHFSSLLRAYEPLVGFLSDRLVFITRAVGGQFHSPRLAARGMVIHDGIDFESFRTVPPEDGGSPLVITTVGMLLPYKGQDILLRALARLAAAGTEFEAYIVGDVYGGRHQVRSDLEQMAAGLGIADRVHFTGFQEDVRPWLEKSNIFVMPSVRPEGLGIVMLEAMAAGRAVVATRAGGVPEVLEDGVNGLLVEPGDVESMVAALWKLAQDPGLRKRLGTTGRETARDFSETAVVDKMLELYEEVTAGGAAGLEPAGKAAQ